MRGYLSADFDAMLSADVEALVDGVSPFAQLAGALVARRRAAVADKEANRRRAPGTRGFHRAVRLLSERLAAELRAIFDEALKSPHGLLTRGSSGSILLVDELLLRRMKALGCRPADLKRLEATCRSAWSGASAAEIRVETGHALAAASEQSVDVRRIAQIALADWVIMDPDGALTGQADADPLIVADRQRRTKVAMERLSENSGMAASIDELAR